MFVFRTSHAVKLQSFFYAIAEVGEMCHLIEMNDNQREEKIIQTEQAFLIKSSMTRKSS